MYSIKLMVSCHLLFVTFLVEKWVTASNENIMLVTSNIFEQICTYVNTKSWIKAEQSKFFELFSYVLKQKCCPWSGVIFTLQKKPKIFTTSEKKVYFFTYCLPNISRCNVSNSTRIVSQIQDVVSGLSLSSSWTVSPTPLGA